MVNEPRPRARRRCSLVSLVLLASLSLGLVAGCRRAEPPKPNQPPPPQTEQMTHGAAADASVAAAPVSGAVALDGTPRIVDSPAGGVHIQYRVYGSGEPLVVLIHGWSCDSNYWSAQLPALKSKYAVATVDLAGHGASGANRSDWSMAAFGADVAAVVDALPRAGKVVLVGHSMGGPVAVEAARRLGPRVVGVIGVDTFKSVGQPAPAATETARRLAAFEQDFIGSVRQLVRTAFFRADADPAFVRRIADDMAAAPPEVAVPAVRALNAWDGVAALKALRVPVIAINADLSPTPLEAIRAFAPHFNAITVERTGHFLMMEAPERVNPILDAEITRLAR